MFKCQELVKEADASDATSSKLKKIKPKQTKQWNQVPLTQTMDTSQKTVRLQVIMWHVQTKQQTTTTKTW